MFGVTHRFHKTLISALHSYGCTASLGMLRSPQDYLCTPRASNARTSQHEHVWIRSTLTVSHQILSRTSGTHEVKVPRLSLLHCARAVVLVQLVHSSKRSSPTFECTIRVSDLLCLEVRATFLHVKRRGDPGLRSTEGNSFLHVHLGLSRSVLAYRVCPTFLRSVPMSVTMDSSSTFRSLFHSRLKLCIPPISLESTVHVYG